jgi:D-xylose transport system substrate-binding protein
MRYVADDNIPTVWSRVFAVASTKPRKAVVPMRKSALGVIVVGAAASLILSACSSSKSSDSGSATSGGASSGKTEIGVILPDTTSSTRYTLYDQPLLEKAFAAAGIKADIQNAQGSNSKFSQIADSMISEGVKVLLIDPADPTTGVAVEKQAKTAGIKVIDYDRVNLGGSADYYVSFDNVAVGKLQGQGLVDCLNTKGVKNAQIIEMDGGTDIDNNAKLFAQGYNSVLDPLYSAGTLKKVSETVVKGWDNAYASTAFQQALTANGGKVDGVIAANDGIAGSVIAILKQQKLQVPVTGQDASIQGLQYVLTGDQCMTVFKDVKKEADAASKLAIALAKGDDSGAKALATGTLHDPTGNRDIPSLLLTPQTITKTNVKDVITAGALTAADICKGIESVCTAAGLS